MNKEQNSELYKNLPESIRQIYDSAETYDVVFDLGKKYHLHIDQIGLLSNKVAQVILGVISPKDFTPTIAKELDLSEDIANLITHDINQQVFAPIRQELMKSGKDWPNSGPKPLPSNVEPASPHFSSAPYQPARPEDPARKEILTAIENPAPTQMITRDNFADKLGQLSQNKDLTVSSTRATVEKIITEKKVDPYLEPIN